MSNPNEELKTCPSCGFSREMHALHVKQVMGGDCSWESYAPQFIRLLGVWFIACKNCGFTAAWEHNSKENTVNNWNRLPRCEQAIEPEREAK